MTTASTKPSTAIETRAEHSAQKSDLAFDIVLPCYNPITGWADRVVAAYRSISGEVEFSPGLILVNDGSVTGVSPSDFDIIKTEIPEAVIISNFENRGKGYTLRNGVTASKAPFCIYTDIDFPYQQKSFLAVWHALKSGVDVAAGIKDQSYYKNVPARRRKISQLLRRMIRLLLRMDITDTQCGLKGFNENGRKVFLRTTIDRYLFDLEFLFLASRSAHLQVQTVEVSLRDGVEFSAMKTSILLTEGWNFLKVWAKSLIPNH